MNLVYSLGLVFIERNSRFFREFFIYTCIYEKKVVSLRVKY